MLNLSKTERFLRKFNQGIPTECWEWTAGCSTAGYGVFCFEYKQILGHRFSYEHFVGPIPDNMEIDHLCRNRKCVNPRHLEAVSHAENSRRGIGFAGINARKLMCNRGHSLTEVSNVYITSIGGRQCITCRRSYKQRRNS